MPQKSKSKPKGKNVKLRSKTTKRSKGPIGQTIVDIGTVFNDLGLTRRKSKGKSSSRLVSAPAAIARIRHNKPPRYVGASSAKHVRITHSEFLRDIKGSENFNNSGIPINPGLATMFPWLSNIASSYESYKFHKLCFRYSTDKGSSASGSVMMAADYDCSDAIAVNKTAFLSYQNAARGVIWNELCFRCDTKAMSSTPGPRKLVRMGNIGDSPIQLFDSGIFQVSTVGCADESLVGEISVEYDVELFTPQASPEHLLMSQCAHITSYCTASGQPFHQPQIQGGLDIVIKPAQPSTIFFNRVGQYLMQVTFVGIALLDENPSYSSTGEVGSLCRMTVHGANLSTFTLHINITQPGQEVYVDASTCGVDEDTETFTRLLPWPYNLL